MDHFLPVVDTEEYFSWELRLGCQILIPDGSIICPFGFCRWDMPQRFQQPAIVAPVHARQRGQFHFGAVFPALTVYHLRFIKADDALCHRVVV